MYKVIVIANQKGGVGKGSEHLLSNLLETVKDNYDYILVDICPSLGSLTINTLTASDEVIISVNPQLLAVMGLQELTQTILKIRRRLNLKIRIGGIKCSHRAKVTILLKN